MARGHQAVARRSLNLPEWIAVRLREIDHWRTLASAPTTGWEIEEAEYLGPGRYNRPGSWEPLHPGDIWGGPDGTFFLRATVTVPDTFAGLPVDLELVTPTEMLLRLDGRLHGALDPNRSLVRLVDRAGGGENRAVELEAYTRSYPDDGRTGRLVEGGHGCCQIWREPRLVSYDPRVVEFLHDYHLALEVAASAAVESQVCEYLYHHLDRVWRHIDRETVDRADFLASLTAARNYLREHVYAAEGFDHPGRLALIGHSHVDVAYHWRIKQGLRKTARTALVQLGLMDEYPEYLYSHSQPYVYAQLKEHWPELWERLKERVAEGRWELVGGMWVEPDCNVPSGESLIRQCLLGKLFFLHEFGRDVDTCWLPDVFGNSWIMPQILKKAGIDYFISNKMSTWNDTNRFPHTNFLWRGVDGTVINACVPASHFNSWLAPDQLIANWDGFAEKLTVGESLNMFGFGDGGGGPTREILEAVRRIERFPGLPRTRHITAAQYLHEAFAEPDKLEVWDDELYLEMHRGVTTTKGVLKYLNRRCELTAREAELFGVLAGQSGFAYPAETLAAAWQTVLVNQFHDILPGSHTTPVAEEAVASYQQALDAFTEIRDRALTALATAIDGPADGLAVFNSLNWAHAGLVSVPLPESGESGVTDADGRPVTTQVIDRAGRRELLFVAEAPSVGYATYRFGGPPAPADGELTASCAALENRYFRVLLNEYGELTSLIDKRIDREVIASGETGNQFQLFEDKPGVYDAWDVVRQYREKSWDIRPLDSLAVAESGPVRAGVRLERAFHGSRLVQHLWLYRDLPRLDFETWVDWQERNKLLKVCFPVTVLARRATYDLSYGNITRPTHGNTTWDQARFEVAGHQWCDLSEAGYGVSLLNDSKYGYDIQGHRIRLSLLRGPIRPDPDSDRGEHRFTYSLYPHPDDWTDAGTVRRAYELNAPLLARPVAPGGPLPPRHSFLTVDPPSVFLGALKQAEDGRGAILRLAEQHGGRGTVTVRLTDSRATAESCDLLERLDGQASGPAAEYRYPATPYDIHTCRLSDTRDQRERTPHE